MLDAIGENVRSNPVAWIALVVSVATVLVTLVRFRKDFARQNSNDYLSAAMRLLERAYDAFDKARSKEWHDLPEPNRKLWLTVARMLKEAEATAKQISEKSHREIYKHARTFYRGKFHDLLQPLRGIPLRYFAEDADSIIATIGSKRLPISDRSLRVILDFEQWPKDESDPLEARANLVVAKSTKCVHSDTSPSRTTLMRKMR